MQHITVSCLLLLYVIMLKIKNCGSFEFSIVLGNIFTECSRFEENVKYAAKTLHMLNKYREQAKLENAPEILYFNIGNHPKSSELNHQNQVEILRFFNILKADVISYGESSLKDKQKLSNRTAYDAHGMESYSVKDHPPKMVMNPVRIIKVKDHTIGVIDFSTISKIKHSSPSEEELFSNGIEYVKRETLKLQNLGVDIIIAIGDGNSHLYEEMSKIKQLDIVIEHSRNVWINVQNHNSSVITQVNVTQMEECESIKYLEKINIESDEDGVVQEYQMKSIFLDDDVPRTKEALDIFSPILREKRRVENQMWLGDSAVELRSNCKSAECNLGNMVTDAMCYYESEKKWTESWTKYPIVMVGDIFDQDLPTIITKEAILKAIPNAKTVSYLNIEGEKLKEILEDKMQLREWMQMSGIRVFYYKDGKKYLTYVKVRCGDCSEPMYQTLNPKATYKVIMDHATARTYFKDAKEDKGSGISDMVFKYIKDHNFTYHHVEDRYFKISKELLKQLDRSKSRKFCAQVTLYFAFVVTILKFK